MKLLIQWILVWGILLPMSLFGQTQDTALFVLVQNHTIDDYKASCQNWDLYASPYGALYVANNSGLLEFDGNTWYLYPTPGNEPTYRVGERNDTIFTQGEQSHGYWLYNKEKELTYYPLADSVSIPTFKKRYHTALFPVPQEVTKARPTVYVRIPRLDIVGTEHGVFLLNKKGKILQHLSMNNYLLQDNVVRDICVQDESRIWLALDNGISQVDLNPPISMLGKRSEIGKLKNVGLQGNTLYIQSNVGYFKKWLYSDDPFVRVEKEEAEKYLKEKVTPSSVKPQELFSDLGLLDYFQEADYIYPTYDHKYWLLYGNEAGLFQERSYATLTKCRILFDNYHLNLTTRPPHIFTLNDSLYAVSAMQGLLLVNIHQLMIDTSPLTIPKFRHIEYCDHQGVHYLHPDTQRIELPHRFQDVNLYVGTTIFTPNHQISYKLEGVSTQWSEWQNEGKITFSLLPEGSYELRVRKYVTSGTFPEISMQIVVLPAWYNTAWAYVGYIFLFGLIIHGILQYNGRRLKREEQKVKVQADLTEQHRLEQLRNKILEDELQNKNNELILQTSALARRNQAIQAVQTELEAQKDLLGDRYPNKLYKKLHTLMEEALDDKEEWRLFESYFNHAHQHFIDRLQERYKELTPGDIRLCCLLRMNLSTKEVASLLNITVRSIELRRYRLRKRLELSNETNLVDFLMKI